MSGHGHVTPNADGSVARCGGPAICPECARELAALQAKAPAVTITVRYSCPACGLVDAEVAVPARVDECVLKWMKATCAACADDHRKRSPHCHPAELYDLKIPMTGADRVGGAPVQ